jgi:hypothetical protein
VSWWEETEKEARAAMQKERQKKSYCGLNRRWAGAGGGMFDGRSGEMLLTLVQLDHGPAKGLEPLTRMRFLFSDYIHQKECR